MRRHNHNHTETRLLNPEHCFFCASKNGDAVSKYLLFVARYYYSPHRRKPPNLILGRRPHLVPQRVQHRDAQLVRVAETRVVEEGHLAAARQERDGEGERAEMGWGKVVGTGQRKMHVQREREREGQRGRKKGRDRCREGGKQHVE